VSFFEELKRRNVVRVGIAYGVATWLLIQVTDIVFPRIGLPDSAVTLVIALLAIGFIPALIFAWAFEMTPEGIKREADVDRQESITPQTSKKLDKIIIAGLVLIIFGMGVERYCFAGKDVPVQTAEPDHSESVVLDQAKTIAVMPFADMSQGQDQEWFSDGLAEEILNALARAPDLLVSSRTSSFAYKGTNTPISQIASDLGVAHVLEGSVRRAGDRIRVTAQLIRTADGFHLWSENYDRDADDIIAIQEELAISIAKALKTTMDPQALEAMLSVGTRSVEAFEHYLNGLSLQARAWDESGWGSLLDAYDEYEKARQIDPGFSTAHARSASFWRGQISISRRGSGLVSNSPEEKMSSFRERIDLAISTASNPIDRQKHEALLALVEMRVRDAIRLSRTVFDARPYDFENFELLISAAHIASDSSAALHAFTQALPLWENGSDWLRALINTSYVLKTRGVELDLDLASWIPMTIARSGKISAAYQAHRALLWLGETEKATAILPYLAAEKEDSFIIEFRQACAEGRRSDAERLATSLPTNASVPPELIASGGWHIYQLLSLHDDAARALKPYESIESPLTVGAYLSYPDFDPTPFPVVMAMMQREGINRQPPARIPFACPDQDVIQQESVAVLPFTSMSSGEDDGYFADGLTEEILNSLASLPELLVTARTSSFHFKGQNIPVPEIATKLGVDHVVEGSVRRAGDRVRITAQLIRASDGFHLWSDTYDRTLEDIFAVQEDIAGNIAETLDVVLNEDKRELMKRAGIGDIEAFVAFQKGMDAFSRAHQVESPIEALPEANLWFDRALAIVPDIPVALYLRTDLYGHIIYNHTSGFDEAESDELDTARAEILDSLDKAIRASHSPAQRALIDAERTLFLDNWSSLPGELKAAFESGESDCTPLNWVTNVAAPFGYAKDLLTYGQGRVRCDPMSSLPAWLAPQAAVWNLTPEVGIQIADRYLNEVGFEPWVDDGRYRSLLATGGYKTDPTGYEPNPEGSQHEVPRAMFALALDGKPREARELLNEWISAGNKVDDLAMMTAEARLGNREAANNYASNVDSRFMGPFMLVVGVNQCYCGAPFDLTATPNFAARIAETGFDWPPVTPIKYPDKDW
jgi:TolB-like protein